MVAHCNVEKQVRRVTSRRLSSHDRPKPAVRSGPKARPPDPKKNGGRVEFTYRVTRVPFLFRGILLRPQESRSDGVCATNLAIQGHPPTPLEFEPGLSDTLIQAVWKLSSISQGGLRTAKKRKNKVPLTTDTGKQGTIGCNRVQRHHTCPSCCRPRGEKACNSMSSLL